MDSEKQSQPRFAFITAIYGAYEKTCKPFCGQNTSADFICFTDDPTIQSNGWIIDTEPYHLTHRSPIDDGSQINSIDNNTNTFNIAKYYKEQWHRIPRLASYTHIVWLDGTIRITSPDIVPHFASIFSKGEKVITIDHDWRFGSLKDEVIQSMPPCIDRYFWPFLNNQPQPLQDVTAQYEAYIEDGYDEEAWRLQGRSKHYGVFVTCVVAWPNTDETKRFLDFWYLQNLTYTTQDQVSFPYCCQKLGILPYTLPDEVSGGDQTTNKFYTKLGHGV